MAPQELKVIVAAPTFKSVLHTMMIEQLRGLFKPNEISLRSITGESDVQKEHLERALTQAAPTALVAIDIRPDPETVAAYTAAKIPIILVDEEVPGATTITVDNFLGGRIAGEYLVKKGRKKIAIVTGRTHIKGGYNADQRLKGFQQALTAGRCSILPGGTIEVPQYSREDGIEAMPKLLALRIDAVFCAAGDNCALGLLSVAKERGVKVPEHVAIIGFDDLIIAQRSEPKLTTIRQPIREMAEAVHRFAAMDSAELIRKPQKVLFSPELEIRESA